MLVQLYLFDIRKDEQKKDRGRDREWTEMKCNGEVWLAFVACSIDNIIEIFNLNVCGN